MGRKETSKPTSKPKELDNITPKQFARIVQAVESTKLAQHDKDEVIRYVKELC